MDTQVKLFVWPAFDGLPSSSPYCTKVIYALRFARIPFETKNVTGPNLPKWTLRGRLPVAEIGDAKVEDSTFILKAFAPLYSSQAQLLYPNDPAIRKEAMLLEDWADESLTLHMAAQRWLVEENWEHFRQNFSMIPKLLRPIILPAIRKSMIGELKARGIGHADSKERRGRFTDAIGILEQKLGARKFLVGEQPTIADFAALPSLQIIRNAKFPELAPILAASKPVCDWMGRVEAVIGA